MSNRKYIDKDFILGVVFLGAIVTAISAILIFQDWGAVVFMKGVVSFTVIYFTRDQINKIHSIFFKILTKLLSKNKLEKNNTLREETEAPTFTN